MQQRRRRYRHHAGFSVEPIESRLLLSASFAAGVAYGVSSRPTDLVVADLNNDGRPDVATADSNGIGITIRFGNADGTFSASTNWATTGFGPERVVAGDIDKDGRIDLVAIDEGGNYSVFRNSPGSNDTSDFTEQTPVTPSSKAAEAELFDMDGDGNLDLVLYGQPVDGNQIGVHIYRGSGGLTFAAESDDFQIGGQQSGGFAVADFDGNGKGDYVAAAFTTESNFRAFQIRKNPLDGATTSTGTLVRDPVAFTTGDFNKDGKPDIALSQSDTGTPPQHAITFYRNDGNGGFPGGTVVDSPTLVARALTSGDIDGDSNVDLIAIAGTSFTVLQGKGDGTFVDDATAFAASSSSSALGTGDFNGDGKLDVVVANSLDDNFTVHLNTSTPGLPDGGGNGPTPTPTPSPTLSATFGTVSLPSVFVPGDKGAVQIVVANAGGAAKGKVNAALYASTDTVLDDGDTLIDTGTSLNSKSINLKQGKTAKLAAKFVAPESLANGAYYLIAKVTPTDISGATEFTAVSSATSEKVSSFGTVGSRSKVKYSYTDADGTLVSLALSGPGTGTVTTSGNEVNVTLNGTSDKSKFTATTKGGAGAGANRATVASLIVNGAIAGIAGSGLDLTSALTVGDVKSIALNDLTGSTSDVAVTLTGSTPVAITLKEVTNAIVSSSAAIKSLKLGNWRDTGFGNDVITAPSVGKLSHAAVFEVEGDAIANLK